MTSALDITHRGTLHRSNYDCVTFDSYLAFKKICFKPTHPWPCASTPLPSLHDLCASSRPKKHQRAMAWMFIPCVSTPTGYEWEFILCVSTPTGYAWMFILCVSTPTGYAWVFILCMSSDQKHEEATHNGITLVLR
jgi:hypothetical protein